MQSGFLGAWVEAEKMIQIALVLPCAAVIGWLLGMWLDHLLHQTWIAIAGIMLGIISGLASAVQMAVSYKPNSDQKAENGNATKKGSSDTSS